MKTKKFENIPKDVETSFDTSNYEVQRTLPIVKN